MATLTEEIAAFDRMRNELETDHLGEWVLIHGGQLINTYKSFEQAADEATIRFGRGPYLIRQIGAPPTTLPASVLYGSTHA